MVISIKAYCQICVIVLKTTLRSFNHEADHIYWNRLSFSKALFYLSVLIKVFGPKHQPGKYLPLSGLKLKLFKMEKSQFNWPGGVFLFSLIWQSKWT